jgi:hypothetical protein
MAKGEGGGGSGGLPAVSVIMPTFEQAAFLPRALESLLAQTVGDWEAVIVDDGSRDGTAAMLAGWPLDPRIRIERWPENRGLGAAANRGLALARAPLIAWLPSDDLWFAEHLATMLDALARDPAATIAVAGVRHHYNRLAEARVPGEPLQPVQVVHRRTTARWTERAELTSDDLDALYWSKLGGRAIETGRVTCEWTDHPHQRHKTIRAPNGINSYRQRHRVAEPLVFRNTTGLDIDERARFGRHRATPLATSPKGLRILLVGELAYNPERVLALAERGHRLFGLWMREPTWFNAVGPQPFGHVEDLPAEDWERALAELKPDLIYALLNWQAVPFAHAVLEKAGGIPFVWHFKEGPMIAIEKGTWGQLLDLYGRAHGRIYSSDEMGRWFKAMDRRLRDGRPELVLDGDLPKADVLREAPTPRLSDTDGERHTVVPGRPIGLHPETVAALADEGVHLHFYGDFIQDMWRQWIERTRRLAGRFLHIHPTVHQEQWVETFSQYDAGWLHFFESRNGGDIRRADWDDLNLPARLATLAVSGVPLLQRDNQGHIVATDRLVREGGYGLFGRDMADVAAALRDRGRVEAARRRLWRDRAAFTFDHHVDRLIALFEAARAYSAASGKGGARSSDGIASESRSTTDASSAVSGAKPAWGLSDPGSM